LPAQDKKKTCLETIGLSSFAEWILSFVQEMGVLELAHKGAGSTKNLFLSFLICEA